MTRLQVFATTEVRCRFFGEGVVLVKEVSFYRRGVSYVSFQGRYSQYEEDYELNGYWELSNTVYLNLITRVETNYDSCL